MHKQGVVGLKRMNESRIGTITMRCLVAVLLGSAAQAGTVDVNQASAQTLATVKGIGKVTAERIVAERTRGAYESMDHLSERLSGIGPKRLEKLKTAGLCAGSAQKTCVIGKASMARNSATAAPKSVGSYQAIRRGSEDVTPTVIHLP